MYIHHSMMVDRRLVSQLQICPVYCLSQMLLSFVTGQLSEYESSLLANGQVIGPDAGRWLQYGDLAYTNSSDNMGFEFPPQFPFAQQAWLSCLVDLG